MSTEENKAVVRRYIEEIHNKGNLALTEELVAPDRVERVHRIIAFLRGALPDWQITIEEQIAEGDKVVTRWIGCGTHLGPCWDFPPTGRPVTWQEIVVMRIADGKIVDAVFQANMHEVLEQVGGKIVPREQTQS